MLKSFAILQEKDPELYARVIGSLKEELNVGPTCPNCHIPLEIRLVVKEPARRKPARQTREKKGPGRNKGRKMTGELFNLLVTVAKKEGCTTGVINRKFQETTGKKLKGLSKEDLRQEKISWLKDRLKKK